MSAHEFVQLTVEGGLMHDSGSETGPISFRIFSYPAGKEILPFDAEKRKYLVELPSPVAEVKLSVVVVAPGQNPDNGVGFVHAKVHPRDDLGKRLYFSIMNVVEEPIGELQMHVGEPSSEAKACVQDRPHSAFVDTRGFYTPLPMRKQRTQEHLTREEQYLASRRREWQRQAIRAAVSLAALEEESDNDVAYGQPWQPNSRRMPERQSSSGAAGGRSQQPAPKTRKCQMKVGFIDVNYPEPQEAGYVRAMYKQFMAEERRLKSLAAKVNKQHSQLKQRWLNAQQAKAKLDRKNEVKRDALKYIQTIRQLKAEVYRQQQEIRRLAKYQQFARAHGAKIGHAAARPRETAGKAKKLKRKRLTRKTRRGAAAASGSGSGAGDQEPLLHMPVRKAADDVQRTATTKPEGEHACARPRNNDAQQLNDMMDRRLLDLQAQIQAHHLHLQRLSAMLPPSPASSPSTPRSSQQQQQQTAGAAHGSETARSRTASDEDHGSHSSHWKLSEVNHLRDKVRELTDAVHHLKLEMLDTHQQDREGDTASSVAALSHASSRDIHHDEPTESNTDTDDSLP